jgi:hypothetical protein
LYRDDEEALAAQLAAQTTRSEELSTDLEGLEQRLRRSPWIPAPVARRRVLIALLIAIVILPGSAYAVFYLLGQRSAAPLVRRSNQVWERYQAKKERVSQLERTIAEHQSLTALVGHAKNDLLAAIAETEPDSDTRAWLVIGWWGCLQQRPALVGTARAALSTYNQWRLKRRCRGLESPP